MPDDMADTLADRKRRFQRSASRALVIHSD
jgi:hypothetical protein